MVTFVQFWKLWAGISCLFIEFVYVMFSVMFREHEGTGSDREVSDSSKSCDEQDVEVWLTDFAILFPIFNLFAIESSMYASATPLERHPP